MFRHVPKENYWIPVHNKNFTRLSSNKDDSSFYFLKTDYRKGFIRNWFEDTVSDCQLR